MDLTIGLFGQLTSEGLPVAIFTARITIPVTDFARLGLGPHEGPGDVPACFRWCFDRLGAGGARWSLRWLAGFDALLFFAEVEDARAFIEQWASVDVFGMLPRHSDSGWHRSTEAASTSMRATF